MNQASEGRRRLAPDERKSLLLAQAVDIFADRGIGRGGHTEIAELSQVSVATVFNYFNTREALVNEVLNEVQNYLLSLAVETYSRIDDPVQAIKYHLATFLQACETNPSYIRVWLEWSASVRDETWPKYLALQNRLIDLISEQIEKGIKLGYLEEGLTPRERARWALGTSQMLVSMMFDPSGKPDDLQDIIARGFTHVLNVSPRYQPV